MSAVIAPIVKKPREGMNEAVLNVGFRSFLAAKS